MNNYGDDNVIVDIVRVMMSLVIMFTYPLCMYPVRLSFDNLLFDTWDCGAGGCVGRDSIAVEEDWVSLHVPNPAGGEQIPVRSRFIRHVSESVFFCGLSFLLASNIPDVEIVFSFTGGTFSSCTSYVFPGLFYLALKERDPHPSALKTYGSYVSIAWGVGMCLLTTSVNVYEIVTGNA